MKLKPEPSPLPWFSVTANSSRALPSDNRSGYAYRHRGCKYPTVAFVHVLHDAVLEMGGRAGLLKPDLLESATEKPVVTVGGEDAYLTLFSKVAAIGHAIAHGHVFNDGNKRTAIEAMSATLAMNRHKKRPKSDVMESSILLVAAGHLGIDGLRMALLYAYQLDPANDSL